jgi:hypothetical protein
MYDADPYVAQRSMELKVSEARYEASRPWLKSAPAPAGRLDRRVSQRLARLLVSLGGRIVGHTLPPYQQRPRRQSNSGRDASPLGQPLA